MKCFYHPEKDAVGICKSCSRGLCKDCLTEVENGIACTASCIEEVKLLNTLINRNKHSYRTTSLVFYRSAYIYGGFGLVFIIYGLIAEGEFGFLTILGLIFILAALLSIGTAKKYRKDFSPKNS